MLENNKHIIDGFFRKKLTDDTPSEDGWNTPPDELFFNAMSEVDAAQNKRKKKKYFLYFLSGIFLLGIIATVTLPGILKDDSTQYEALESTLTTDKQTVIHESLKTNQTNEIVAEVDQKTEIKNVETEKAITSSKNKVSRKPNKKKANNKKQVSNSVIKSSFLTSTIPSNTPINDMVVVEKKEQEKVITFFKNNDVKIVEPVQQRTSINGLKNLDRLWTDLSYQSDKLLFNLSFAEMIEKNITPKNDYEIGLAFVSNLSHLSCDFEEGSVPFDMVSLNNFSSGWGIQGHLTKKVNKRWSFQSQISFNNIMTETQTSGMEMYDVSNEQMQGSSANYATSMDIPTPFGNVPTQANFQVEPGVHQDMDLIYHETKMSQMLKIFSFQFGTRYNFYTNDKINVYAMPLVGVNYISGIESNMETEIRMHDELMMAKNENSTDRLNLRNAYLSLGAGAGVDIKLNDYNRINFSTQWNNSVQSLRNDGSLSNIAIGLNQIQFGIGISRKISF